MEKRRIVTFDFDGTLTTGDTFIAFALHALTRRRVIASIIAESATLTGWKCGIISNGKAKQRLFKRLFGGMPIAEFNRHCSTFATEIDKMMRHEMIQTLKSAREGADKVYIISASIENWIKPWAKSLGIDEVIATRITVDSEGIVTGGFNGNNCYGAEKVRRLQEAEPQRESYILTSYGDSRGDREILAFADRPHLV